MLKLLATPRWLAFTATALVAIIAFGLLSHWQWLRAEEKRAANNAVIAELQREPVQVDEALAAPVEWRRTTLTGTFGEPQFLLRNRPLDGSQGFWVLTPLTLSEPQTMAGEVIWVARGWMAQTSAATQTVQPPGFVTGSVQVETYLRAASTDPAIPSDSFPAGQVAVVNTSDLAGTTGLNSIGANWYAQLAQADGDLKTLPLPESDDARNLSYAGQWLLFAAIAIGGWYYFLRREVRESLEDVDQQREATPDRVHAGN